MKKTVMVLPFISASPFIQGTKDVYARIEDVKIVGIDDGKDPLVSYSDIEFC